MTSPNVLYAHREDEITTLLDAIDAQKGSQVLLVIPDGAAIFRDLLNLKLLKRECEKLGKTLAISTQDSGGIAMAKKAAIPVEAPSEGEKFFEDWGGQKTSMAAVASMPGPAVLAESAGGAGGRSSSSIMPQRSRKVNRGMDIMPRRMSRQIQVQRASGAGVRPQEKAPGSKIAPMAADLETANEAAEERAVIGEPVADPSSASAQTVRAADNGSYASGLNDFFASAKPDALQARSRRMPWLWISIAGVLIAGFLAAAFFISPSATVIIWPKQETVEFEMDMAGRTDISSPDAQKAIIPLERIRIDKDLSRQFPSTGNREITTRAKGIVTVYNEFSSAPQPLVASTRFRSEDGKIFRTPKAVVIPGAVNVGGTVTPGTIEIEIVADEAGESYNIPPGRFSIPGFSGTARENAFYGISAQAMAGGFNGKSLVVEASDIEKARQTLVAEVQPALEQELRGKLPPGLMLIEGALHIATGDSVASPEAGQPGDAFTLKMVMYAEALLFKEEDVLQIVDPNISAHLASQYLALPDTKKVSYAVKQVDATVGRLAFTTLVTIKTQAITDPRELAAKMAGMSIDHTKAFFGEQAKIERADLSLWPFWARRLPEDPTKIKVQVGGE
ncbi:MAG: hypothetical protein Q8Q39_01940 [bacterium]|nr:hypothetical protein [bacterium]